jgi:hypothetical protein
MAGGIRKCGRSFSVRSRRALRCVLAAVYESILASRGISATTTSTVRSIQARSIGAATAQRTESGGRRGTGEPRYRYVPWRGFAWTEAVELKGSRRPSRRHQAEGLGVTASARTKSSSAPLALPVAPHRSQRSTSDRAPASSSACSRRCADPPHHEATELASPERRAAAETVVDRLELVNEG